MYPHQTRQRQSENNHKSFYLFECKLNCKINSNYGFIYRMRRIRKIGIKKFLDVKYSLVKDKNNPNDCKCVGLTWSGLSDSRRGSSFLGQT